MPPKKTAVDRAAKFLAKDLEEIKEISSRELLPDVPSLAKDQEEISSSDVPSPDHGVIAPVWEEAIKNKTFDVLCPFPDQWLHDLRDAVSPLFLLSLFSVPVTKVMVRP
jgi:hypothetical protein